MSRHRASLVRQLEASGVIHSTAVREAFLQTPRETFIPMVADEHGIAAVYRDEAYPTKTDAHGNAISSSSQPGIMACMLEALRISPGQRVLEVGAGTGYNSALLSALVGRRGRVTSVELDPDLARAARRAVHAVGQRAQIVIGDGREGWEAGAPYDRIIATASSLDVPLAFRDQLKEGGIVVMPLRLSDALPFQQLVIAFERQGAHLGSVSVIHGGFMRLRARPDDPSLPWQISEVVETREGTRHVLASISGSAWGAFSPEERGRLLVLMLSKPRSRSIGMRVSGHMRWGLQTFLALGAPEAQLVGCTRADLADLVWFATALPGVVDHGGGLSLAHLGGGKAISRIDAYGGYGAERLLARLVEDWRSRRRRDVSRLHVEVAFGRHRSTREPWRTRRRGSSVLLFDWA